MDGAGDASDREEALNANPRNQDLILEWLEDLP
jgi:hypothetical protein